MPILEGSIPIDSTLGQLSFPAGFIFGPTIPDTPRFVPVIQQIMEAMESELLAQVTKSLRLSFMTGEPRKIVVLDSVPGEEPKSSWKRYLITIFPLPDSYDEVPRIGGRVERLYKIGVACWRKSPRSGRNRIFSDITDTISGIGVFELTNYVMDVLRNNTLNRLVNLTAGKQFSTPEIQDTGDDFLERVDFSFNVEVLNTVGSGGVQ